MKKQVVILASLLAASHGAVFASNADHAAVQFSSTEAQQLFEHDGQPMQMAELSQKEMKATEGAFVNFIVGGAMGFGMYAAQSWYSDRPITWQGSLYSAGTGALTGGIGGALIRASGGGIAGNIAWRPNIQAANFSFGQYRSYRGW